MRIGIDDAGDDLATGQLHDQISGPLRSVVQHVDIGPALEPIRSIGRKAHQLRRSADRGRCKVGRLDQDIGRALTDLGVLATHDACNAERLRAIGDEQRVGRECSLLAIQRYVLGRESTGGPDLDEAALHRREVKGMQRMSALHQHEVRHIDDIIARSKPDRLQTSLQPLGRRPDRDATNQLRDVARGKLWVRQ